jgi:predicted nucleic acid-binding protein
MGSVNWYFDTSVLVPAAVARHPHNASALAVLEELVRRKHRGFISAHSLTEVYSVLTRTPFKPPLYPSEAWQLSRR